MTSLLDSLLAPLAKLLVARGILFPEMAERLKAHYVDAAPGLGTKKITDSRLSVLTGLQRRDIVRLRNAPPPEERVNHLSTLVARWQTDARYKGAPLRRRGDAPSFEALANEIRKDIHPRTMLDTLIASGTVAVSDDGETATLLRSSYQPLAGSEDQLAYLADSIGDHFQVAIDNVLGTGPARFERSVHYSGLTKDQITALEKRHEEGQMALFQELSQLAAQMKAEAGAGADSRFRAGAYFHAAEDLNK